VPVSGHPGLLRCEGRHTPRPAGDMRALGGSRLPAGSPALSRAASAPDANARIGAALGKREPPEASLSPAPRSTRTDLVPSAAGRRRPAPACRARWRLGRPACPLVMLRTGTGIQALHGAERVLRGARRWPTTSPARASRACSTWPAASRPSPSAWTPACQSTRPVQAARTCQRGDAQ